METALQGTKVQKIATMTVGEGRRERPAVHRPSGGCACTHRMTTTLPRNLLGSLPTISIMSSSQSNTSASPWGRQGAGAGRRKGGVEVRGARGAVSLGSPPAAAAAQHHAAEPAAACRNAQLHSQPTKQHDKRCDSGLCCCQPCVVSGPCHACTLRTSNSRPSLPVILATLPSGARLPYRIWMWPTVQRGKQRNDASDL